MRKAATSETWKKPTLVHPISVSIWLTSDPIVVWFVIDAGCRVTEAPKVDESGSQPVIETEKHVEELPSNDADAAMNVCFEAQAKKTQKTQKTHRLSSAKILLCHGYPEIPTDQRTVGFL